MPALLFSAVNIVSGNNIFYTYKQALHVYKMNVIIYIYKNNILWVLYICTHIHIYFKIASY